MVEDKVTLREAPCKRTGPGETVADGEDFVRRVPYCLGRNGAPRLGAPIEQADCCEWLRSLRACRTAGASNSPHERDLPSSGREAPFTREPVEGGELPRAVHAAGNNRLLIARLLDTVLAVRCFGAMRPDEPDLPPADLYGVPRRPVASLLCLRGHNNRSLRATRPPDPPQGARTASPL